jgi:D-sedoheptulose 7-phosphate isomerase
MIVRKDQVISRIVAIRELSANDSTFDAEKIEALTAKILGVFTSGSRIAFVGNGGSAAEAMHLAAEFTGRCVVNHRPLPALCLNESQSALTAIANDFGVDEMFSRQVQAHLRQGDLLIALTTSGKSENIRRAVKSAREKNIDVVVWMGNFDHDFTDVDVWRVPSSSTPRIQEVHLMWGHILAELVEVEI